MCIVIDQNTLANVFNRKDSHHSDFKPVLDWILFNKGKIVIGGTTYRKELRDAPSYLRVIGQFSTVGKVAAISDYEVDEYEKRVSDILHNPKCDDPHLIAIIAISGCRLICTNDSKSHRFIKRKDLYVKPRKVPHFYSNVSHKKLLNDKNIPKSFQPFSVLGKENQDSLDKFLTSFCTR
jgi:hypothetical protein